jgi:hypothetical protein
MPAGSLPQPETQADKNLSEVKIFALFYSMMKRRLTTGIDLK